MSDTGSRRRGLILSAVAALVVAAIYVLLRQRNVPDLLVQSDEGWQPEVRAAVGGEVGNPGTYMLRGDARLSDLVAAAGGYTDKAERAALNPAARVSDGMEYIIPVQTARLASATARASVSANASPPPNVGTTAAPSPPVSPTQQTATKKTPSAPGRININTASQGELEALPAIGPAIAQRIIDDRTANGPYKQIEDLARVRGVSARTVEQLRERITVAP
ncbi:MAG: ComEA family DNA-binding protein [Chloroflexota bacterium]|nr:ComEA family DNA-binding protein [Chloroflexota bacterium]MDQ6907642.1 ComEA family DNA-binding protein [Chloroflexota bacterium]